MCALRRYGALTTLLAIDATVGPAVQTSDSSSVRALLTEDLLETALAPIADTKQQL